jgi:threonine dehydratase
MEVTLDEIQGAAKNIAGVAVRTPLLPAPWAGGELALKPECLQVVGAFKIRGAYHAVASLSDEERKRGVIASSSGNHAQAVAYAARAFGTPATIVIPDGSMPTKIAATEALGADVVIVPPADRFTRAAELADERGLVMIPPYDDYRVIAGQGTVGLEIMTDYPEVDVVLAPIGGGGLISGIAAAVKAIRPQTVVIGVEPELAAETAESLRTGERAFWPADRTFRTIADGLRASTPGELTFPMIQQYVDDVVTVSEQHIRAAIRRLALGSRIVAEPSGAVATAAHLFKRDELPPGRHVAVITGGNIDPTLFAEILTEPA